jgi:NADH-quinone oxidoreductase subunit M
MDSFVDNVLLVAVCAPLVCGLAISVTSVAWWRSIAVLCGVLESVVALAVFYTIGSDSTPYFVVRCEWVPSLGISFYLGVDGLSAALLLAIALVFMAALFSARDRGECIALLCATAGALGAVVARDFFLYCFFCEMVVWPLCLMAALRGGQHRESAALQFALHSLLGGTLLLFVAASAVYYQRQAGLMASLAIEQLVSESLPLSFQFVALVARTLAFALRTSLFPFHTWAMVWHRAVSRSASMAVVGGLLPLGAYGLLRFALPLCSGAIGTWRAIALPLLMVSALAATFLVLAERHPLRQLSLIASCQMAWIAIGIASLAKEGIQGAAIVLIGASVVATVLSCLLDRGEEQMVEAMTPWRRWGVLWAALTLAGLPGLGLFPGHLQVALAGVNQWTWQLAPLALVVVLCAVWALRFFAVSGRTNTYSLSRNQYVVLLPLVLYSCVIGLYPASIARGGLAMARVVVSAAVDNGSPSIAEADSSAQVEEP